MSLCGVRRCGVHRCGVRRCGVRRCGVCRCGSVGPVGMRVPPLVFTLWRNRRIAALPHWHTTITMPLSLSSIRPNPQLGLIMHTVMRDLTHSRDAIIP